MKILLINDYLDGGGAEAVFRDQFDILKEDNNVERFYANTSFSGWKSTPLSYIYSFFWKKKLTLFLQNRLFDRIIVHNYSGFLSPSILDALSQYKKKNSCKIIHYAHDYHLVCPNRGFFYVRNGKTISFEQPPSISEFIFKRIDYRGFAYSILKKIQWIWSYKVRRKQKVFDLILAPSDFLTNQINRIYPDLAVNKMYNFCNALSFNKKSNSKKKTDTLRMVFFGRIAKEKGLAEFISALQSSSIKYTFTIIGEGDEKMHIKSLVSIYNLEEKVFLKDKMDASSLFLELINYDVFVMSSLLYENAPLTVVEAASLGLNLFLANHGGVLEMGKICQAKHFFKPDNPESIISSLSELYADFLNNSLPEADYKLLQNLFSKDSYISNLKKYLEL